MRRVYLDSCVVIYAVEGRDALRTVVRGKLLRTAQEPVGVVISDLTRLECRVWPKRRQNMTLLAQYDAFFMSPGMISAELSSRVFDLATDLRATHGLKTADALHLAAALSANCEELWTNDGRLGRAAGDRLRVVIVGET